jgi:hypothetical protein
MAAAQVWAGGFVSSMSDPEDRGQGVRAMGDCELSRTGSGSHLVQCTADPQLHALSCFPCFRWLQGPPAIGKGVSAAVKDRFPEVKEVVLV